MLSLSLLLAAAQTSTAPTPPPSLPARVLERIAPERLRKDVERVALFGTRHTLSDAASDTRGVGAARRWLEAQLREAGGRLSVTTESFTLAPDRRIAREVELVNVLATLPGTMPEASARTYVVLAHYDSRASEDADATSDAPGANDDGSGTALVLEIARALANEKLDSTVVFLLTAGEEQGLHGATHHADGPSPPARTCALRSRTTSSATRPARPTPRDTRGATRR